MQHSITLINKITATFTLLFFAVMSFIGNPLLAEGKPQLKIQHQILENQNLKTFFGVYDEAGQLLEDISINDIFIQYDSRNGRVDSLNKFSSERFGTAYLFMIDISKSMSNSNFELIKQSIEDWVVKLNLGDSIAIMTFGESVQLIQDFTFDKNQAQVALQSIVRTDMLTKYYDALRLSSEIISRDDSRLPFRRVVITLTDGLNDLEPGALQEDPEPLLEKIESLQVPYFTIGFAQKVTLKKLQAIKEMEGLSNVTGGIFFDANQIGIEDAFKKSQQSIDNIFLLSSSCSRCRYDQPEIEFRLEVNYNNTLLNASRSIPLKPQPSFIADAISLSEPLSISERIHDWWVAIGASLTLMVGLFWFYLVKRRQRLSSNSRTYMANTFYEDNLENDSDHYFEPLELNKYLVELKAIGDFTNVFSAEFNALCSIGRSSKSNLCLANFEDISSIHCKLLLSHNQFVIKDIDSTNGTFLNGARVINNCPVSSGDELTLASNKFKIFIREN
jgi:hypothetical protein